MMRQAAKKGLELPDKFWSTQEWKLEYKRQIVKANTFLKVYNADVVVATLLSHKNTWVNSLYLGKLSELIDEVQLRLDRENHEEVLEFSDDTTSVPSKYGKQSQLSRMRDIENE